MPTTISAVITELVAGVTAIGGSADTLAMIVLGASALYFGLSLFKRATR